MPIHIDSPSLSLHAIRKAHFRLSTIYPLMVPEMEKPQVTEIKVRMDCNGCVLKIKKALNGISGINDFHVDLPQQKITIIGWADPEKLVKAIKKTRKNAVIICVQTEQCDDQPPEGGAPPPEPTNSPPAEATPPPEAPNGQPDLENPSHVRQSHQDSKPEDAHEEVHVIYQHPPDYGDPGPGPFQPPQPVYVTHSYNTYKPSPYVTEYTYPRSPPRYSFYSRRESYSQEDYHNYGNSNITSIFSEENPNACTIV